MNGDPTPSLSSKTIHSLPEILRMGRQADPDGIDVRISRQAVEEAAIRLERAQRIMARAISWLQIKEAAFATTKGPAIIEEMQRFCAGSPPETKAPRCGWFGEGRGQCLLDEGHEAHLQTSHHTCEQDGRMLDVALTGLAAVSEAERRSEKATADECQHDLLKPDTTIEVIDKWKAKCKVCINFFDLPGRPEPSRLAPLWSGDPPGSEVT